MERELKIDLSTIGVGEEDVSENDDTKLTSDSAIDELMSALDALDGHADDSIQVSRDAEMYWITTLNERDELILSNKKSISELQLLNKKLREENQLLREQLSVSGQSGVVAALQDDAAQSRNLSMQLQAELAALQLDVVARLKDQNSELQGRLVKCGQHYSEVFNRLRQKQQQDPKILELCAELEKQTENLDDEDRLELKRHVEELCDAYDQVIGEACDECEQHLQSIETLENENLRLSARGRRSVSPRKSRPGSSMDTDKYYTQLLQSSENANMELRKEIENLHKEMNSREQRLFGETMARTEHSSREQIEKMKTQISELSQEMSLLNVDNRALREKILRTENENEILVKRVKDSAMVDTELKSLQANLDSQLELNHKLEAKVSQLELIRMEHNSICQTIKTELEEAKEIAQDYDEEHKQLSGKLKTSKELQQNYDTLIAELGDKLQQTRNENSYLMEKLQDMQQQLQASQKLSMDDLSEARHHEDIIQQLHDTKEQHLLATKDLTAKLESTEKQRENANMKVKALRERLKNMQDSWQKISTDTESSFSALREQYQQQIKEYKSIVQSLKSQNASLNIRIDSLKKVSSQYNASQVTSLEQQIAEYKQITSGYREENILLRKELRNIVLELQNQTLSGNGSNAPGPDEFARLRDILNTAKSECENLQLHKPPHSRASSTERVPGSVELRASSAERASSTERRAGSVERRTGSVERRTSSVERRTGSVERRTGSVERRTGSVERRTGSTERRAGSAERRTGSAERSSASGNRREDESNHATELESKYSTIRISNKYSASSRDVNDLYEPIALHKTLQSLDRNRSSVQHIEREPLAISTPREETDPISVSTPRQGRSAEQKSHPSSNLKSSSSLMKDEQPSESNNFGQNFTAKYTNINYGRSKYEHSGNMRSTTALESQTKDVGYKARAVKVDQIPPSDRDRQFSKSVQNATIALSKTKEVVEIKNRNSAELDPSKSFKPINPDDDTATETSSPPKPYSSYKSSSYTATKPSYVTTSHKYYPTNSATSSYEMPYRSKYEPTSYKPKSYGQDHKSTTDDYRNISADSAYSSPSRSFSKAPSVSSHTSSYHKGYALPSLRPTPSKYSSTVHESKDSLTKLIDYEIEQTDLLNRTLDDLELSMDSVSGLTSQDRQLLNPPTYGNSSTGYSSKYTMPTTTGSIHLSTGLGSSKYTRSQPKRIDFHGTVVYKSIYK